MQGLRWVEPLSGLAATVVGIDVSHFNWSCLLVALRATVGFLDAAELPSETLAKRMSFLEAPDVGGYGSG